MINLIIFNVWRFSLTVSGDHNKFYYTGSVPKVTRRIFTDATVLRKPTRLLGVSGRGPKLSRGLRADRPIASELFRAINDRQEPLNIFSLAKLGGYIHTAACRILN